MAFDFFKKKDYVCETCGKTFTKRFNLNGNKCDECFNAEIQKEMAEKQAKKDELAAEEAERKSYEPAVIGYVEYAKDALKIKKYSKEELINIAEHNRIKREKFRNNNAISKAELAELNKRQKELSEEEGMAIVGRVMNSAVESTIGAHYCRGKFFVSDRYSELIVDAEDVFAVGFARADFETKGDVATGEILLCAIFTNDPYVPVLPVVYEGKIGFFDGIKSKKGRKELIALYTSMCPNLKYEVDELKKIKGIIKKEKAVRGNIEMDTMLNLLDDASYASGFFKLKKIADVKFVQNIAFVENLGYIFQGDIDKTLNLSSTFGGGFWKKLIKKYLKEEE